MMDLMYELTMVYLEDCPSASVNWTRNIKSGVTDKFLEGAAIVTVSTEDHNKIIVHTKDIASESDSAIHEQKVESSNTSAMFTKLQLQRLLLQRLQFLSFTPSA